MTTWQDAIEMGGRSDTELSLTFRNWQVAELIGKARSPLVGALAAIIADPDCCAASKAIARDALEQCQPQDTGATPETPRVTREDEFRAGDFWEATDGLMEATFSDLKLLLARHRTQAEQASKAENEGLRGLLVRVQDEALIDSDLSDDITALLARQADARDGGGV